MNNKDYIDTYIEYMFNDLKLKKPNADANTLYNQVLFASSCDFNNIYIFGVPRLEKSNSYIVKNNYLTPAQKSVIVDSLRNNKALTSEPVVVDPIYVAIDIGATTSGEIVTSSVKDNTQIQVVRSKDSRISTDNIRKQTAALIKDYFKTATLGQTINFSNIINSVTNLTGVKSVYTVRTDITGVKLEGINFILYNPVYPDVDIEASSSIVALPDFKYPYLNDAENFINKITVVTEDRSVY
jgi:hypothetical protein